MACEICVNLERAFEARHNEYIEARAAVYYRVSTQLAASIQVDMERARNELEEHWMACVSRVKQTLPWPVEVLAASYAAGKAPGQFQSKRPLDHSISAPAA